MMPEASNVYRKKQGPLDFSTPSGVEPIMNNKFDKHVNPSDSLIEKSSLHISPASIGLFYMIQI